MNYFMGIDYTATGVRAILLAENGEVRAKIAQPPRAEDQWAQIRRAIGRIVAKVGADAASTIRAIGLTGQMTRPVFLDDEGSVLCVSSPERRQAGEEEIAGQSGFETFFDVTGNNWLGTVMWLKNNDPRSYARVAKIVFPKDYIRFQLTGELTTEISDASQTGLFDAARSRWNWDLIDICRFPRTWFARICRPEEVTGKVVKRIAESFNLPMDCCVVGGGNELAAGVGLGVVEPGIAAVSLGTTGAVVACSHCRPSDDAAGRLRCFRHAVKGKWCVSVRALAAEHAMRWLRDRFFQEEKRLAQSMEIDPYDLMSFMAKQAKPGSSGLFYLPYSNCWPPAGGGFIGATPLHGKNEMARSVMEGVIFSIKESLDIIAGMGVKIKQVRVTGGGARSEIWQQMQADIYGKEVVSTNIEESAAAGAAILAAVGTGFFNNIKEACDHIVHVAARGRPKAENMERYKNFYARYRGLYPALRPMLHRTAKTGV